MDMSFAKHTSMSPDRASRQSGVAAIEFALVITVALTLVMGSFDLGRAYYQSHVLLEAAQSAARVGALPLSTGADVKNAADEVLESAGITDASVVSTNVGAAAARGTETSVTVAREMQTMTGSLIPGWTGEVSLSRTARMRHE
jgi:Flp pilus assembly protein TadG